MFATAAGGRVDFEQSSGRGGDQHSAADAQTPFFRTLREVVGRLERDLQETAAGLAEPREVQDESDQRLRTAVVGVRRRQRRSGPPEGEEKRPADVGRQNGG